MLWYDETNKLENKFPTFSHIMEETRHFVKALLESPLNDIIDLRVKAYDCISNYVENKKRHNAAKGEMIQNSAPVQGTGSSV